MRWAWVWMLVSVFACGAPRAPSASSTPEQPIGGYTRQVAPFEFTDRAGVRVTQPFLGGFNLPRPQLVDIDGDDDLDLFVQEYSDELMFFENIGDTGRAEYRWRTDRYQGVSIGEWYRFVDLDQDGVIDLLAERPFSHISYYRNAGDVTRPRLILEADSLRDDAGKALFSDRQNIPQVTDLDCDGTLDLYLGQVTGTVTRYEAAVRTGTPRFRFDTERYQDIEIVAQIGSRHGANTMAFMDVDQDGDEDLFWGDFFEPGLLLIENRGSCASPDLSSEPVAFPVNDPVATSGYNAPAFGDLDGDGDVDLLVGVLGGAFNPNLTSVQNLFHLEQVNAGVFDVTTERYLSTLDVGSESIPAFVDLDADGDLDLWLSNKIDPSDLETSRIYRYENVGSARAPIFQEVEPLELRGAYHYAPAFADLDDDGDLDMLLATWRDEIAFYRNEGSPTVPQFSLADSALVSLTRGSNATPALGDLDGDGDVDLMVGEGSGTVNFYWNVGTPSTPAFELESDSYLDIDIGRRSAPTLADLDQDGDLDLIVGSEANGLALYRNRGTRTEPRFVADRPLGLRVMPFSVPRFIDIDADGDLDLFAGGIAGGLIFYEYR